MLIQCPECDLQVSDKANTCPHCGYPLKPDAKPKSSRKPNKRRRLPNGFGQISEIKGRNLRNPFRAMVTVGKDKNGKPICKPLKPESYFQHTMMHTQLLWNLIRIRMTWNRLSQSRNCTTNGHRNISRL